MWKYVPLALTACAPAQPFAFKDAVLDRWFELVPEDSPEGDALIATFGTTCVNFGSEGTVDIDASNLTLDPFAWSDSTAPEAIDIEHLGTVSFSVDETVQMEFTTGVHAFSAFDGSVFLLDTCWWAPE